MDYAFWFAVGLFLTSVLMFAGFILLLRIDDWLNRLENKDRKPLSAEEFERLRNDKTSPFYYKENK